MKNLRIVVLGISIIAISALFFSCVTKKISEPIKIETECAIIDGNIVANQGPDNPDKDGTIAPASGDMFYMMDSGTITFSLEAPADGTYLVKIYYAIPNSYGGKEQNIIVNGADLGNQAFAATGGEWKSVTVWAELKKGINEFIIKKNWGYTWFDYITLESAPDM